jgi:hypothetical protein
MNVLLLRWDTKPDKRIRRTFLTPCNDTQNVYLCRCPVRSHADELGSTTTG